MSRQVDVVEGVVVQQVSNSGCRCCEGGRHVYSAGIRLAPRAVSKYEHLNDTLGFISNFASRPDVDGKRVRITIEVIEPTESTTP